MKVAIIDNLDSFTYNLQHYLESFAETVDVFRVDELDYLKLSEYDKLVISPGPGLPKDVKELQHLVNYFQNSKPIIGICLGHQAIAEYYGAKLKNKKTVDHGVSKETNIIEDDIIFQGISKDFMSGRYHSWIVDNERLPKDLIVTAIDSDGFIMAFKHARYNVRGVQFHPESVLTPEGMKILENWVKLS